MPAELMKVNSGNELTTEGDLRSAWGPAVACAFDPIGGRQQARLDPSRAA